MSAPSTGSGRGSHRKIIIGTCRACGRLWLVSDKSAATVCQCGSDLLFSQPATGPVIVQPSPEAQTLRKGRKGKKGVVAIPRHDPPEKVELPTWIEPLPLSDYGVVMLGAQCGAHVLSGSPPREAFVPGQLITLINRFWEMALWLEAGQGGDE